MIDTKERIAELISYLEGEDSDYMDGIDYANQCIGAYQEIELLQDEVKKLMDGMELAWGVIANAYDPVFREGAEGGKNAVWAKDWKTAADRWRDEHWHPSLKRNCTGEKEEEIEETK